jgi:hypothetical protein
MNGIRKRLRAIAFVIAAMAGIALAGPVWAEPAFAVRTGYSCTQCHVNRTGGGLRTAFGSIYTQTTMPSRQLRFRAEGNLLPADPDARFSVGSDVRTRYTGVYVEEGDDLSTFEVSGANVYAEVRLAPDRFSLYLDETLAPGGARVREAYGLFQLRRGRGYVKFGRFLPVYGWRLPDDDAFIREPNGFAYSAQDIGVEVGFEPGRWSVHAAVANGSRGEVDSDRSKQLTLTGVRRFGRARLGVSASNNKDGDVTTTQAGLFGGVNFGRLALLAEGDWGQTGDGSSVRRHIGYFEADLLIVRGLNLKYAHDWMDPDLDNSTDARQRDSLGIEWVPYPFVKLSLFGRRRDGPRQFPALRDDQFELELHLFF